MSDGTTNKATDSSATTEAVCVEINLHHRLTYERGVHFSLPSYRITIGEFNIQVGLHFNASVHLAGKDLGLSVEVGCPSDIPF